MTTPLDAVLPGVALSLLSSFGVSASLYTTRDGETTATVKVSPAETKQVLRSGTNVYDLVSECLVAATDAGLTSASFPVPPRPGDVLTYKGRAYPLIDGTGSLDSGASTAAYVLRFRG